MGISALEYVIIIGYLIGMVIIGVIVSRRVKSSDDYLAGGRRQPYLIVTATLFATWWCGGTILGGAGAAFHGGFHGVMYDPYGAGLTLVLAGLLFMKIIHDAKVNTLAEFFTGRYGPWSSRVSGIVMIPTYALFTAVQLVGMAKIFQFILGWPYAWAMVLGAAIILIYTVLGGIMAVAWTDVFQISIALIGIIIIFPLATRMAGGWQAIREATPTHFFKFFPAAGSELAPPTLSGWLWWLGAVLSVGLGTLAGPDLYQRAIMAKNGRVAKAASLTSGFAYWGLGVIPVFLAFAAITLLANGVLGPDAAAIIEGDSEQLVLVLAKAVLPGALAAIFIAALMAAIMSTGDSAIFATAAVLANDIVKPIYEAGGEKKMTDRGLIASTRISVAVVTVVSVLIAFFYANMYDLLIIGFQLLFHILFFPLILGVYWKRANAVGSIAGMLTGFLVIMIWMIAAGTMFPEPEWLSSLGPGAAGGVVMILVSLATGKTNSPLPLRATDGTVLKWPELAK